MSADVIAGWRPHTCVVSWRTSWEVVEFWTRDGVRGFGEWSGMTATETAAARRQQLADELVGRTIEDALGWLEAAVVAAARAGRGYAELTVLGGLDAAVCDLAARHDGVSLAEWLGAQPAPIPLYANINRAVESRTPEEFAAVAKAAVAAGFSAVKCAPFDFLLGPRRLDAGLTCAEAVRDAVGQDVDVMFDLHGLLGPGDIEVAAPRLRALAPRWLEDVAPLHDLDALARAADLLGVPIADGELAATVEQIAPAIDAGLLQIVMPDVKHAGGPRAAAQLGRFAAERGLEVSFHNPWGPVATAHAAAASAACGSARILEFGFGEVDWREQSVEPPERVHSGWLQPPETAGIGISVIDEPFADPPPPYPGWYGSNWWSHGGR